MDLVTFIPGILNSASFSPGPATPAPFNVNHVGLVDGSYPDEASANVAQIYNRLLLQIASCIQYSGLTINNDNWAQLPYAVEAIAQAVVNGSLSGGVVTTAQYNNDFVFSHGTSGYQRLKNGLIIQWGQTQSSFSFPSFFTTTFPLAFPTAVYQVLGSMENTGSFGANVFENDIRLSSKTTSTATWFNSWIGDGGPGGASAGLYPMLNWIAIGK